MGQMTDIGASLGAILLAGGDSSRLGRSKQLLEIDGQVLVRRQARLLLGLEFASTVVVTGSSREGVVSALADLSVTTVHNDRWSDGMGGSLACGIRSMPERVRGAVLLLCDQWRVNSADLCRLLEVWSDEPGRAVISEWDGQSGPPAVFPRALFEPLRRLQGDRGARRVVKRYSGGVQRVPVANAAFDIDRPAEIPA